MHKGIELRISDKSFDESGPDVVADTALFLERLAETDRETYDKVLWRAVHSASDGHVSVKDTYVTPPVTRYFPTSVARKAIERFAPADLEQ